MSHRFLLSAAAGVVGVLVLAGLVVAFLVRPSSSSGDPAADATIAASVQQPQQPPPPNPGYREGIGNIHADASTLALLLAHTAGDTAACGNVCSEIEQPAALQLWFSEVCDRLANAVAFTVDGFAAEVTPAAHRLITLSTSVCSGVTALTQSAGPPDRASAEWQAFAESHRHGLNEALAAVPTGTRG